MREIKFRAWDNEYKVMRSWNYINEEWTLGIFLPHRGDPKIDVELMQFTGLKDKNGKEIYEGDILKADDFIAPLDWDFKHGMSFGCFTDIENAKIIGNIYENPNLIS